MKMKTGPKVLLLALLFVGLGYWAGRGFPRTWDDFLNPQNAAQSGEMNAGEIDTGANGREGGSITSRRVDELEDRISDLEKTVADMGREMQAAPSASSPANPAAPINPPVPPVPSVPPASAAPPGESPFPSTAPIPDGSL